MITGRAKEPVYLHASPRTAPRSSRRATSWGGTPPRDTAYTHVREVEGPEGSDVMAIGPGVA